jgi:branched-chain amino acid aminotransferase
MLTIQNFNLTDTKSSFQLDQTMDEFTRSLDPGLFTTFITLQNRSRVIGLKKHLLRLNDGTEDVHFEEVLRHNLKRYLKQFVGTEDVKVRIVSIRKVDETDLYFIGESHIPINPDFLENGVVVNLSMVLRETPRMKSTAYISKSNDERNENLKLDVYESLIVKNNLIREGFTSNVYFIKDQKLITASRNILSGVTRKVILTIARQQGMPIEYRSLRIGELPSTAEAFISSSSRGVVPIKSIVGYEFKGEGRGVHTKLIQDLYFHNILALSELI